MKTGRPPGPGEYVVYFDARQSGETDCMRMLGSYHGCLPDALAKPGWMDQDFWIPYEDGGFWLRLPEHYIVVRGIRGWIGPLEWNTQPGARSPWYPRIGELRSSLDAWGHCKEGVD